jgi:hypothetical protein
VAPWKPVSTFMKRLPVLMVAGFISSSKVTVMFW